MKQENRLYYLILIVIVLVLGIARNVQGSNEDERKAFEDRVKKKIPFTVRETSKKIKIDGVIDDEGWEDALKMPLNYETDPGENNPAMVKTDFFLVYDKTCLYVAFRCFDPDPAQIRARLSDRDHDYGDDFVGVLFDTFNDERKNFILWSNPRGVQEDAIMSNSGYNISWDGRYKSVGKIGDFGYVVEMAIPFSTLRFQRTDGDQIWGLDAWRLRPRDRNYVLGLVPHDPSNNCIKCQMLKIKGFAGIKPGRNIEITPTVTGIRADSRTEMPDGKLEKMVEDAEIGVTARWGVTPNMTLSGTVNPDFSQVEADAWQLNINKPFALFYNEKRPFFTEGADFFSTRLNAVYTRTLRDPSWGIKLTGKEGNHNFGGYLVKDQLTNLIFPGSQGSASTSMPIDSMAAVARYKFDIGTNYTVGALFTSRNAVNGGQENGLGDYFNHVYGVDGRMRFSQNHEVTAQVLGSSTRYADSIAQEFDQPVGTFSDRAIFVDYNYTSRNILFGGYYRELGPDFRADLGFIPQVGYSRFAGGFTYRWIAKPNKWWSNIKLSGQFHESKRKGNRGLLTRGGSIVFQYEGALQSELSCSLGREREAYNGQEFDLTIFKVATFFHPLPQLLIRLDGTAGDRVDYDNTRAGKRMNLTPNISWFLGNHLRLNLSHTYEHMRVNDRELYTANISQGTLIYQFNTKMFFRSIVQYVDYKYNTSNYLFEIEPEFKHLFMQLLLSYKLNPQTVVFLGYTDNFNGTRDYPVTRVNRAFFLKIGYAWQL